MTTTTFDFHITARGRGRKAIEPGAKPEQREPGRVPRVARLVALTHHFEGLLRDGVVADYADIARLCHVTRARVSQIMNLTLLAPDIQEAILHLNPVVAGRDRPTLRDLQRIALVPGWPRQRCLWTRLKELRPRV